MTYDEQISNYLDSIIYRANQLRNALRDGTLTFPDGESAGKDEILDHLETADQAVGTIAARVAAETRKSVLGEVEQAIRALIKDDLYVTYQSNSYDNAARVVRDLRAEADR